MSSISPNATYSGDHNDNVDDDDDDGDDDNDDEPLQADLS